jgi:phosphoribosylformylglycinamidine (FGAM) synthase-like amidotransferase family enzyme
MSGTSIDQLQTLSADELAEERSRVRVLVITGLGLNCEVETGEAFRRVGATVELVHLNDLLDHSAPHRLTDYSIIAFPGGFAFGDHLGAGFVFANKIRWRMYDELVEFIEGGGLAIGICNGFQMMTRLGMVPGFDGDYRTPRATLAPNNRLGYWDTWVRLEFDPESPCVWTRGLDTMDLPSRHGEGKFLTESPEVFERLEVGRQIAARYVDETGEPTESWPANPNGSPGGIAAVCDPSGRLFGIMPHPDAFLYPFQHPQWQAEAARGEATPAEGAGLQIFRNGVDYAASRGYGLSSRAKNPPDA